MKINEQIYSLRKKQNLSQEELANKLNVTRQTISKWELGESLPDLDKIVPLCEIFKITPDELLIGKKNNEIIKEYKPDKIKALLISVSIFLYFIGVVSIIFLEEYVHLNDGVIVSIFLTICGIATSIIIFTCMTRPSNHINQEKKDKSPKLKNIIDIISLITTAIYLLVSFLTMAWHITWIIWIIYSFVVKIIELIYGLKEQDDEK